MSGVRSLCVLVGGLVSASGCATESTLRVQALELVDSSGRVRARLGVDAEDRVDFKLLSANGDASVVLRANPWSTALIQIRSGKGSREITIGDLDGGGVGGIRLTPATDATQASLVVLDGSVPVLELRDVTGSRLLLVAKPEKR